MSISSGKVWVNPKSDTVTFVMRPETPTTEMLEGYGLAMPELGIVMAPALAKVRVAAEAQTSSASVAARIIDKTTRRSQELRGLRSTITCTKAKAVFCPH